MGIKFRFPNSKRQMIQVEMAATNMMVIASGGRRTIVGVRTLPTPPKPISTAKTLETAASVVYTLEDTEYSGLVQVFLSTAEMYLQKTTGRGVKYSPPITATMISCSVQEKTSQRSEQLPVVFCAPLRKTRRKYRGVETRS